MERIKTTRAGRRSEATQQIIHGQEDLLAKAVSRYLSTLHKMARRKLANKEDGEDAVQDALLSAFKHMDQFKGQAQLSTWLATIVLNSAKMQLRRKLSHSVVSLDENHKDGEPPLADRLEDSRPNPEEALSQTETRDTLEALSEKLPRRIRSAFRLRVFEGFSTREAADALGISQGTLKARFFRASRQVIAVMREAAKDRRRTGLTSDYTINKSAEGLGIRNRHSIRSLLVAGSKRERCRHREEPEMHCQTEAISSRFPPGLHARSFLEPCR
jgi:RNA polymerase sigma-70 factor (ECF subfamily)